MARSVAQRHYQSNCALRHFSRSVSITPKEIIVTLDLGDILVFQLESVSSVGFLCSLMTKYPLENCWKYEFSLFFVVILQSDKHMRQQIYNRYNWSFHHVYIY